MSSEPDKKSPKTLDDLVPIVADVIEHAQSIQETAEGAVGRVNAAAALVASTAKTIIAGQANLGADIEKGVGEKFNTALNGASARIGQQLALAEQQSKAALVELTTETHAAVQAIKAEADALTENWWIPTLISGALGALLGAAISGTTVYMVMSRVH